YYTPENAHISKVKTSVYREFLKAKDQAVFDEIIKTVPSYDGEYFDPIAYYRHYLKYDCLVLRAGFIKFSHAIEDITSNMISVYDCLSISSLTDKFAIQCGAYRGVHEVCCNLREYIGRAVYGGRVHVNTKYKKKVLEGRAIADYDGVSLYPSAIHRLCREQGFPMGLARRFNPDYAKHLDTWREKDYAVLTVRIKEVRKNQQMPFIAHRGDGVIDYLNKAPAEPIVIDKTTLEDYIEFHDVVYEVLDGVYWNSGFNKRMGKVVETLFNARLEAKAAENDALQNTLKLMLNSAYGKTVLKKSNVSYRYVTKVDKNKDKKDPYENYIAKNFKTIRCITPITDELHEIESITADVSYNRAHIGCSVLSMSKRIMNEVMDIANSNDIPIFYQDTDSMHMYDDEVEKLKQAYGAKYGRELDGKQLGQFHVDFDLDGAKSKIVAT
ncbi:MAG: DNA polymerase, partial [Candidatus Poseidoniales archaeon]